jgi:hypothetical protein
VSQLVFILVSQIMSEKSPLGQALLLKGLDESGLVNEIRSADSGYADACEIRQVRLPCARDGGVGDLLGER